MLRVRLRGTAIAAAAVFIVAAGASAAQAATVTVTGDDGNPVGIAQGTPTAIRNMSPVVGLAFPATPARFSATVTGPDGAAVATSLSCFTTSSFTRYIDYRGNGNYTVTVTNYANADTSCRTPTSTETYVFTIGAGVGLAAPPGPFLIRNPNSFATNTLNLPVGLNPGTTSYEVRYAAGGVVGPDGAISGPSDQAFVSTTTGTAGLSFRTPGSYTVVARASVGQYSTPWSAPIIVRAIAPFDLDTLRFPDARGPSYQVRGALRETSIRGRVSLAIARGKKGGKYRSLGSVKISSKGTFTKRFRETRAGTYRIRVRYKGSSTVASGTIVAQVRITRRVFFG
ncbi:hypothetical protein FSW04_24660 [Baekduia soli]|uniref:Bacterial Ig-like domain-containing protein n=1 Tax=Baekduia soli TaxID=496014 RepID=A0A5B8UB68_9ACTN|nr:hypothetical protein [Baekduia soli]QEC50459.1 hypothetical protein FSW04_24660 [Baekduia soli]